MDSEGSVLQEKPHLPVIVWCRQHKNAGRGTGRRTEPALAALTLTAGGRDQSAPCDAGWGQRHRGSGGDCVLRALLCFCVLVKRKFSFSSTLSGDTHKH